MRRAFAAVAARTERETRYVPATANDFIARGMTGAATTVRNIMSSQKSATPDRSDEDRGGTTGDGGTTCCAGCDTLDATAPFTCPAPAAAAAFHPPRRR